MRGEFPDLLQWKRAFSMSQVLKLVQELGVDEAGVKKMKAKLCSKFFEGAEAFSPEECRAIQLKLGIPYAKWQLVMRCDRLKPLFCSVAELKKVAEANSEKMPPEIE